MTEENRSEILQKLIYSAQNENSFTISDLNEYLLSEHVDSEEDIAFFQNELREKGLLIDSPEEEEVDFIEDPTSDEIADMEDEGEEDDLLADDDDEGLLDEDTSLDLIEEPTDEDLEKVEEEESEDDDEEDEDEFAYLLQTKSSLDKEILELKGEMELKEQK